MLLSSMKKKVLTFFAFLLGMTLIVMFLQIARYGSLTGYLTSANVYNEGVSVANNNGYALSIFEPERVKLSAGSGKISFLKVLNSGISNLANCVLKGEGELNYWIISDSAIDLKVGESALYSFSVKSPEDAESGEYVIPFLFSCYNYESRGKLLVEIEGDEKSESVATSLTGLSISDVQGSSSPIFIFVIIGAVFVLLVGIYLHKKNRKMNEISNVYGYNRKYIKLDLKNR